MLFSQPALHEQLQPTESDYSKVNTPTTSVKSANNSSCSNSSEEASCPGSYLSESLQTDDLHQHINGVVLSNSNNVKNDSASEDSNKANTFPSVIQIWYSTKPEGPSLSWTTDQDGQPCVFTVGHLLSNRSLFPSQDSPSALSSWQASVTVDENLSVLMTGDHLPTILTKDSGRRKFCYATSYPMPSSTFALAIGSWKMEEVVPVSVHELEHMSVPPIRLIFPECLREITSALLQWYLPRSFLNVQALLGVYPFHRLDVLIVPACFDSLGMARPNRGENSAYVGTGETCFLKNGMNTVKVFMQVHYLKGYFLLHELEHHVGRNQFLSFLRKYLQKFAHKLVTSQDFLNLFFETFPDVRTDAFSVDTIYSDWLDHAGLPKVLMSSENGGRLRSEESKKRANQIAQQLAQLKDMDARARKRKRKYEGCKNSLATLEKLEWPVQIMLLFDQLLEEENLTGGTLDLLKEIYHRHFENAEVFHRWCELVIKHKRRKYFSDVRDFWRRHQAMGVYLYGEAMISEDPDITKMARDCFRQLQHDMPASVRETVSSMLFPS
ncbi:hypothetical protein C0Q70_15977 [Pomacea canaliculata]|uniref:Peptidase M1 leukotriene A4 hydrolase/aminopeptidase C-terminal domain-containing protein n=1 Tax=Pomacea canaliculata TaxID=400727 RepID=A0A2T7NNG9_POMCA|nr:hypothetical protein C0Q70_15977 [Pomacea canaliculata]